MSSRTDPFELTLTIEPRDIDIQGHVNNVVYLRYAQDAAVAHWRTAPPEIRDMVGWVARRHEIDYLKPAFLGEQLVARTWVGVPDGARFERFVEIVRRPGDELIARVRTDWVAVDPARQRPKRIPRELYAFFAGLDPEPAG